MKKIIPLLSALILASMLLPAHAIPTDWHSNMTAISNVYNAGPFGSEIGERPRLGAATFGYIEGEVLLPSFDDWTLQFTVSNDGNIGEDINDFVRVFLDGNVMGNFTNTAVYPVNYLFTGDSFDYRFEFTSSNTNISFHQIVNAGTVTMTVVNEPLALSLFVSGLLGLRMSRRRNEFSKCPFVSVESKRTV